MTILAMVAWGTRVDVGRQFLGEIVSEHQESDLRYSEAYSWGVGEDESGGGLYCGFEGVVGAAVIGVQDTPGLEVRDDTFDEVADTIDGRVVSPVAVCEFTIGGFPGRGDHSQSDVAFVSNMRRGIKCCEEAGFLDGLRIMNTTRQGWGDPGEASGQGAGHLKGLFTEVSGSGV